MKQKLFSFLLAIFASVGTMIADINTVATVEKLWSGDPLGWSWLTRDSRQWTGHGEYVYWCSKTNHAIYGTRDGVNEETIIVNDAIDGTAFCVDDAGNWIVEGTFPSAPSHIFAVKRADTTFVDIPVVGMGRTDIATATGDIFSAEGGVVFLYGNNVNLLTVAIKNAGTEAQEVKVKEIAIIGSSNANYVVAGDTIEQYVQRRSQGQTGFDHYVNGVNLGSIPGLIGYKHGTLSGAMIVLSGDTFAIFPSGATNLSSEFSVVNLSKGTLVSDKTDATKTSFYANTTTRTGGSQCLGVYVHATKIDDNNAYIQLGHGLDGSALFKLSITESNVTPSGTCGVQGDNLTWSLTSDEKILTISGSGEMMDYVQGNAPWYNYREIITEVVIENGVTSIGERAFYGCSSLTSVTIPNSVTSIGDNAFYSCTSLISFDIPNSVTSIGDNTFYGCTGLNSVTIGNSVTSIGDNAFYSCTSLISFDIPNSVTSIGDNTFYGCTGLNSVTIGNSVTSIGDNAFYSCTSLTSVDIPNSVTSIGSGTFSGCTGLNSVTIGNSVTSIGWGAFYGCSSLTSVIIPNSVTSIGERAFYSCSGLTSVTIGNSVNSIGDRAFYGCNSLTSVTMNADAIVSEDYSYYSNIRSIFGEQVTEYILGDNITSIGSDAFSGCSSLTSVTIPNSVTSIGESAFSYCGSLTSVTLNSNAVVSKSRANIKSIFGEQVTEYILGNEITSIGSDAFSGCSSLTSIVIPNSVTSIGDNAFISCSGLTSITIPNSVTSIGDNAFLRCSGLTSITIPNSVTSIGGSAFYGCSGLTSVTIGNSVTSIGNEAFMYCSGLASITIGNSVTSIGDRAFSYCDSLTSVTLNSNAIINKTYSSSANIKSIFGEQVTEYRLGNDITGIGNYAFSGCSSLTSVHIPNSVTSIGDRAFFRCGSLTSITIPNSVTSIGVGAFYNCSSLTSVNIPNSVTSIGGSAFYGCSGLASVNIPNSVTSIGGSAFYGCSGLTSVTIGNSVTSIGERAFNGCSSLTSVTIPNSVTSIGEAAFYNCRSLTSVTIGNSVTIIGANAFYACSSLTSVTLNSNAFTSKTYSSSASIKSVFGEQVTEYILGDEITSIGDYAFNGCSGMSSLTIGNSVTSIGYEAFGGCSSLTSINVAVENTTYCSENGVLFNKDKTTLIKCPEGKEGEYEIPNNVARIGNYAFYNCSGLTSVIIPNSVTNIGGSAFSGCSSLTDLYATCGDIARLRILLNNDSRVKYIPLPYSITVNADNGNVNFPQNICDALVISVISDYGYHFTQWSDGNTDNPRTIELTHDTTFTAEFALNKFSINVSCDEQFGHIVGENGEFDYLTEQVYVPIANYGYHFVSWSDGNVDNPRRIILSRDTVITAIFLKNKYNIVGNANITQGIINGCGEYEYMDSVTLAAVPNAHYHFSQWSDGITDNPRTIVLTNDTTIEAIFTLNKYSINATCDTDKGRIEGENGEFDYLTQLTYTAVPNYGYHFDHWEINLNQEYVYVVAFSVPSDWTNPAAWVWKTGQSGSWHNLSKEGNMYVYRTTENDMNIIVVPNGRTWMNGQTADLAITENCCYTIVDLYTINKDYYCPNAVDASTVIENSNPLQISVSDNHAIKAYFSPDVYTINDGNNTEQGYLEGRGSYDYLSELQIKAIPNYGYHFMHWSDGKTENPRTIVLTQDTTFTAEFAIDKSGTCGENNTLIWSYNDQSETLTVTGDGALTDNYTFGVEAPTQMNTLIIGDGVTAIGDNAFNGKSTINHLSIGANVASIGNYTFAECRNFDDITCYATIVPTINATTFANIGNKQYIYLYVPADRERAYKRDTYWGEFDIQIKSATTTTTDSVKVTPTETTAEVTWPVVDNAATYELTIKDRNGDVICTLIFNAQGQLTSIAFAAPSRAQQSTQSAGFSFTVTGLDSGSNYSFTINAKDGSGEVIDTKSGTFDTTSDVTTDIDNLNATAAPVKVMRNGKLFILRDGKTYTVQGQEVE